MRTNPPPPPHPGLRRQSVYRVRAACVIGLLASCVLPTALFAAPLLRCQVRQGGITKVLDFIPVGDPYSVAAIDIDGLFRFKAVVIGDERHIEYIKLYVYGQTKRQPMLIHQATYLAPVARSDAQPSALTGVHHLYSSPLERELQYGCALLEKTP